MTDTLDVTRAVAVLNAAVPAGMISEGGIPEGDAEKIIEAERIIVLARQAKTVADAIGAGNVPNYQHIINVLAEAEVFLGIGSAEHAQAMAAANAGADAPPAGPPAPASAPAQPQPPADMQQMADATGMAIEGSAFTDPPGTNFRAEPGGAAPVRTDLPASAPPQAGEMPQAAATQGSAPPAAAPGDPATAPVDEEPQFGETWSDSDGNLWEVGRAGGGPQVEARPQGTAEWTVVPSGFLKTRVHPAPPALGAPAAPAPPPPTQEAPPSPPSLSPPAQLSPLPSSAASTAPSAPAPSSGVTQSAGSGTASVPPSLPSPPSAPSPSSSSSERPATAPVDDDEGDEEYANLLAQVEHDYNPQAMPVPMDLEQPPAEMPDDLTDIGDLDQRRLHSQFNALAARARYLRGLEAAKARACKRVRKRYMKDAMREARGTLGKEASVTEVTAEAEEHELVAPWLAREVRHEERASAYGTFLDFYTEDVSVLSRDWTMRAKEEAGS